MHVHTHTRTHTRTNTHTNIHIIPSTYPNKKKESRVRSVQCSSVISETLICITQPQTGWAPVPTAQWTAGAESSTGQGQQVFLRHSNLLEIWRHMWLGQETSTFRKRPGRGCGGVQTEVGKQWFFPFSSLPASEHPDNYSLSSPWSQQFGPTGRSAWCMLTWCPLGTITFD